MIFEKVLKESAILILINKADKALKDMDINYYTKKLAIKEMFQKNSCIYLYIFLRLLSENQRIKLFKISLLSGEGVSESLEWLIKAMKPI